MSPYLCVLVRIYFWSGQGHLFLVTPSYDVLGVLFHSTHVVFHHVDEKTHRDPHLFHLIYWQKSTLVWLRVVGVNPNNINPNNMTKTEKTSAFPIAMPSIKLRPQSNNMKQLGRNRTGSEVSKSSSGRFTRTKNRWHLLNMDGVMCLGIFRW